MHVTFYGAVREVTGSLHLLQSDHDRILLDCGMHQGRRKESNQKNSVFPFDPAIITNMVLSHAHIDHSGRIPLLTKRNFNGRVICTRATADACRYLLADSAHIQESDADYLNYKTVRAFLQELSGKSRGKKTEQKIRSQIQKHLKKDHQLRSEQILEYIRRYHLEAVEPLYTRTDAQQALSAFDGYPYCEPVQIGRDTTCTLYDAGHILGSAISIFKVKTNGKTRTICYTGDLGRFGKPIIKDPCLDFDETDRFIDLLIMESTYGNRLHAPIKDLKPELQRILTETYERGGTVLIPAFAFGRTQELLYILHQLYNAHDVHRVPVYIDSPLATNITKVFGEHPEVYDRNTHRHFLEKGENPFRMEHVHFIESTEESMQLNREEKPHIVIAASGMCEAGRILHHLRHKIHNPKHTVLIVGFMAEHTLGRRILEQGLAYAEKERQGEPPELHFLNKAYPLKAHVAQIDGFSAHADQSEMLQFLERSNLQVKRIALVHGEEEQTLAFAKLLSDHGYPVTVPRVGESLRLRSV